MKKKTLRKRKLGTLKARKRTEGVAVLTLPVALRSLKKRRTQPEKPLVSRFQRERGKLERRLRREKIRLLGGIQRVLEGGIAKLRVQVETGEKFMVEQIAAEAKVRTPLIVTERD